MSNHKLIISGPGESTVADLQKLAVASYSDISYHGLELLAPDLTDESLKALLDDKLTGGGIHSFVIVLDAQREIDVFVLWNLVARIEDWTRLNSHLRCTFSWVVITVDGKVAKLVDAILPLLRTV